MAIERRYALLKHGHNFDEVLQGLGTPSANDVLQYDGSDWGFTEVDLSLYAQKAVAETVTGAWTFNADLTMASDLNLLSNALVWAYPVTDVNDAPEDQYTAMTFARIGGGGTNTPETTNNANGILSLTSHVGAYGKQLFFADNDNLWMRRYTNNAFATWYRLLSTKDPVPFTDANETITGAWTFSAPVVVDTDTAGPMVTIGDGAGADGDSLLRFMIDRPWSFRQQGAGAGAALQLYAENSGKVFRIGSAVDPSAFIFNPDAGIFNATTVGFSSHLRVGNNSAFLLQQPANRGTVDAGGSADNGGVGGYHGYSINNDIMFMHNGTSAGIYDEINDEWRIRFDTNSDRTVLYANGFPTARTQGGGMDVAGANSFIGFYSAGFGTRHGYLQINPGVSTWRSEVHGADVQIQGESVGGSIRNLFFGDPDGAATLYFQGGASIVTTAIGAIRSGRGAFPHFNSATNSSGRITTSTAAPSGTPAAGDIWIQHEA